MLLYILLFCYLEIVVSCFNCFPPSGARHLTSFLVKLDMRYLAAYLLCQMGGTSRPQGDDLKNILTSVGVECDKERLDKVTFIR